MWKIEGRLPNGQSLQIEEKFYYPGERIGARGAAVDDVITRLGVNGLSSAIQYLW